MSDLAAAYGASGAAWRAGPEPVYERLADALLDHAPRDLLGATVLDVGAGTGVASRVALRRGAQLAVAADLAAGMLRQRDPGLTAVVADAQALPFADDGFDLVVAAFSLSHVPDPGRALREAWRVAPAVAVSVFDPSWDHPAKQAVDQVMARYGFVAPPWYADMKRHENVVEDPARLEQLARDAGHEQVRLHEVVVDTGLATPSQLVGWRMGMAHLAPFLAGLDADERLRARVDAEAAVTGMEPVVIPMLALSAARTTA